MIHHITRKIIIGIAVVVAFLGMAPVAQAATVGPPVPVSPSGHIVAEFSAATVPTNPQLMVASAIDSDLNARTRCAVYVSRNGGTTWAEVPAWSETSALSTLYDPWVAATPDGTLHAMCIVRTHEGSRVGYVQSTDQGHTWTTPRLVTPWPGDFHRKSADKAVMGVDDNGTLYACFSQVLEPAGLGTSLIVSHSADQGLTWTTNNTGIVGGFCNGIVASSNGSVTVAYIVKGESSVQYGTVTSTDGGNTWGTPADLGPLVTDTLPSMARDTLGRTVIATIAGQAATPQLNITLQNDTGSITQQWQLAKPSSPTCTNGQLINPSVVAAPTGAPALQVACKIAPTGSTAGHQEVWLYPAIDLPATTAAPVLVSGFALPPVTSNSQFAARFPTGGDYWGFTWRTGGWLAMWIDPRIGAGPGEIWATPLSL